VTVAMLVMLFIPLASRAQDTGYISGTVSDKSGAAISNATVVITSSNLTRNTTTNSDGAYVAAALPPGTYNLEVMSQGFQKFQAKGVVLTVAQKLRVDVTLTVGTLNEEVVVSGESVAQVETESSEISTTITGKQVNQLELNGRNFTQLITLVPGVVNQTGQDEGTVGIAGNVAYSVNGGRTEYNNWEIDGGDNMDNGSNTSLNVYPNLEAIAEFKVLTSNYGAQYGRNASGTVEIETKSGTNTFHGSAFEYLRNDFFNANSWQDNGTGVARPEYKKHDFGYTVGGPIYIPEHYNSDKKKTFFFWSQEFRREKVPGANVQQAVPSDAERGGDFNDVCPAYNAGNPTFSVTTYNECPFQVGTSNGVSATAFANNMVPITPTGAALVNLIPHANNLTGINGQYAAGQAAGTNIPTYVSNPSYPTTWREELIRVDHNFTENERLTVRYIHDSWSTVEQGPLWGVYTNSFDNFNTNFAGPTTSFVTRLTSNLTPTLLNEFVASYTADHIQLSLTGANVGIPSGGIDLVPLFANNLGGKLPAFSVANTNNGTEYGSAGFAVDTGYFPWKNANPTYTYRDNLTKILGRHTLIFGAYFAAAQKNQESTVDVQGQLTFSPLTPTGTGNPFADLLNGQVGSYGQTSAQPYFYDRYKIFEPYLQDDFRVSKKLTLNLGLRWSIFGRYQEKFDQEYGFSIANYNPANAPQFYAFNDPNNSQLLNPATGNAFDGIIQCGAKGVPTGCMKNKWINPAPRIGFAYDPFGNGKWAIRGGYGIFFEHSNGNEANAESLQASVSPNVLNGSVSNVSGYANVGAAATSGGPYSPLSPVSIPDQMEWPYVQQWNLDVQHELPGHVVLSVAYVGSKGTHLALERDLNQLEGIPASENPYIQTNLGPITSADCQITPGQPNNFTYDATGLPVSATLSNGTVVTGRAVQNLFVACGGAATSYYRPYQGFGTITRIENTANSTYHALQISGQRTVGDLTVSTAYTYSHSIDNSSDRYDTLFVDSYDPNRTRASSNFDQRHNFTVSYVYAFPFFKSPGVAHTLLGGWQVSGITTAQSGIPFTVTNGTTYGDNAGVGNGIGTGSFPDLVGNPNVIPAGIQADFDTFGKLAYNPAAFTTPMGLTFGDVGRNSLRYPGRLNFDFGLFKRFAFKEHYAFEFRWENFNVFNHTQLDQVSGNLSSGGAGATSPQGCVAGSNFADPNTVACVNSGFLTYTGAHLPRIMQFGLRFQF